MPEAPAVLPFIPIDTLLKAGAKPIEWHWQGWIPKGTFQTWLGRSGIGKSWSTLDLAICTCYGLSMLGRQVLQGHVLYVSAENAWQEEGRRIAAILAGRGITDTFPMLEFFHFIDGLGQGLLAHDRDRRLSTLVDIYKPALVVLDSASSLAWLEDENSNAQVGSMIDRRILPWHRQSGVTTILTHNAGKGQDKEWVARGASAWKDKADGSIAFWQTEEGPIELWQPKVRIGRAHPPVHVQAVFEGGSLTDPTVLDTKARFELIGPIPKKSKGGLLVDESTDKIKAALSFGELSVVELGQQTALDEQAVRRRLGALEVAGLVTKRDVGQAGKRLYKLVP